MTPSERERKIEAVRRVLMDVVADGDAALHDLSEWAADVLNAIEKADENFAGTRLNEAEADRVAPASAVKDRADGVDDPIGPDPGTPSERERRIEYRIDASGGVPILHDGLGCRPATAAEVAFEAAARDFADELGDIVDLKPNARQARRWAAEALARHPSFSGEEGTGP